MSSKCILSTLAVLALAIPATAAEPAPGGFDARVRYRIDAYRNERLPQFYALVRYLESVGFHKDPGPDDEADNREVTLMTGTVPTVEAGFKLLVEPHVRSVQLVPHGAKLPEGDQPVRVRLQLAGAPALEKYHVLTGERPASADELAVAAGVLNQQRQRADQVRVVLKELGFREASGYDTRGNTRLVGQIPVSKLDALLDDLRKHAAAEKLGPPFSTTWPLVMSEVQPDLPYPPERPVPLPVPQGQERLTPDLRAVLADQAEAAKPRRMEVILSSTPDDDREWRKALLAAAPDLSLEGRHGPLVTVRGPASRALLLAELPFVSTVRLPRSGQPRLSAVAPKPEDRAAALRASGVERLHLLGRQGQGYRVVILDGDFRGWQALLGKELPADTKLFDLTGERNPDLQPDPAPDDTIKVGHGTQCAAAAAAAAPKARFLLVRIDPSAPHQLLAVAQAINGDTVRSVALDQRQAEIEADRFGLDQRREELQRERKRLLDNAGRFDEFEKIWAEHKKKQDQFDKEERAFLDRQRRYLDLVTGLQGLRGVNVVASPLVWNEGHPFDGGSALSRWFDDRPFGAAVWLQSAGNTRGQSWSGVFNDVDGNGVMEFAPPGTRLPAGRWTPELNFLGWHPDGAAPTAELPANAIVRVSVQWREAHDPTVARPGEDPYREPLADLRLVLYRQLDPAGAKQPKDDLEVVAQSVGLPQRLDNQPASAVYEQTLEFTVKEAGHYAVAVEGRMPRGTRPASAPTVPAAERSQELHPRAFVETLGGPGRAVFLDYAPEAGGIGVPADARRIITIGAAERNGRLRPDSAGGPPHDLGLLPKPDLLAYDTVGLDGAAGANGASLATAFAAGLAASAMSAGTPQVKFLDAVQRRPGALLLVPK